MRSKGLAPLVFVAATAWLVSCDREYEPVAPETPEPQTSEDGQDIIPRQHIIVFHNDLEDPRQLANELAQRHGLTRRFTYEHAIKGFSAIFPEAGEDAVLEALRRNPNVDYIEPNQLWYIDTHPRLRDLAEIWATVAAKPLSPPTNVNATAVSNTRVDVTWTDTNNGESGYEVYRCIAASGPPVPRRRRPTTRSDRT